MNESISLAKRLANVFITNESEPTQLTPQPSSENLLEKDIDSKMDATLESQINTTPQIDYTNPEILFEHLGKLLEFDDGETIIELGVGLEGESLGFDELQYNTTRELITVQAKKLNACVSVLYTGELKQHVLVRSNTTIQTLLEIRIAVVGNVDAGKSTLLGVLTKNVLDDGRGKARLNLFKHKHEIESGRTSSVGMEVLGFTSNGLQVTPATLGKMKITWEDVSAQASKIITFVDLAGHEKYLKTTVFGLTGSSPDYAMLIIAANNGIIGMTKEHLSLCLQLHIPLIIIITKIDIAPANILAQTITQLEKTLRQCGSRKLPIFVKTMDDVFCASDNFVSERICPIFQISNTTGENMSLLLTFLNIIKLSKGYNKDDAFSCAITDTFSVPGVGTVVSGTVTRGMVHSGDTIHVGPDSNGVFHQTIVKSIHRKRLIVHTVSLN